MSMTRTASVHSGTLKGFPNPPAMVRGGQSPPAPHALLMVLGVAAAAGCTLTRPIPADVRVPPELLRGSQYNTAAEAPRTRYVVRMTDGQKDWYLEIPESGTGYEVKIPMSGKPLRLTPEMATMTAADREILQEREAAARA